MRETKRRVGLRQANTKRWYFISPYEFVPNLKMQRRVKSRSVDNFSTCFKRDQYMSLPLETECAMSNDAVISYAGACVHVREYVCAYLCILSLILL